MTATAPAPPPAGPPGEVPGAPPVRRRRSRALWLWGAVGLVVVLLGTLLFLGRPDVERPPPLSPTSEWPDGTKGLVLLLEAEGAEVTVTDDAPGDVDELDSTDVLLIPVDFLYELDEVSAIDQWVDAGGRLVVTDPYSQFTEITTGESPGGETLDGGGCTIDALVEIDEVTPGPEAQMYDTYFGDGRCFTEGGAAFVTTTEQGDGTVVSVGGPMVFTNELLDDTDNAGLAVALLAPEPGTRVRYLDLDLTIPPPDIDRPDPEAPNPLAGFLDMVPPGARAAAVQLIVAFLAYAWWRGRRVGRPVTEPQAVQIEGSELVAAVGRLLERSRDPERAAAVLRADLRRTLSDRLGLPRDVSTEVLVRVAAERTGESEARIHAALAGPPLDDHAALIDLARLVETIRQEVLHGSAP